MEAAGLAIGVVGLSALISSCKHLMDQIDSFRHVGSEARPILADFAASKLIFDRWLQNVDVNGDAVQTARGEPVDEKTARVLQDLISCIRESLKSIEVVVSDFSTSPAEVTQSGDRPVLKKPPTGLSTKKKFQWAFSRKEKAIKEVQGFYRLVQKLHALIPVSGPSGDARSKPVLARDPVDELTAHLDKLSERNKAETRRSIDQWLGAKSTESYYEDCLRHRQDETCSWIFDRPAFVSWISPEFPDDSAKLLWLHAPPGFGKTILCARIVESLKSSFPDATALYFFSERQNDSYAILRSWISQIVYQHDEALQTAISNSRIGMTATATHSDMEQMFHSIVQSNSGLTFVVDGLDECENANETSRDFNDTNRHNFLKTLRRLISNSKTRILVVSRGYLDIRSALCPENDNDKVTVLQIGILKDDVEDDLKAFSKAILDQRLANRTEELRTELADQMAERADGMFLWVKLHQSALRGSKNKKRLQEIICSMPQGLHRTYNKNLSLINSLDSVDRSRAFFILRWLVVGLTLPTVGQIAVGFAVLMSGQSPDLQCDELPEIIDQVYIDEEIINTCAGLVEVKAARLDQPHQYRKLSFIHSSTREYLLQVAPEDSPVIPSSNESFHRGQICETFLRFLNFDAAWERPSSCTTELNLQPFLTVAVREWIKCFPQGESISEELSTLLNTFFSPNNPHWNRWRDAHDMENLRYGVLWMDDPIWEPWARLNAFILDSPLNELAFEYHNRLGNSDIVEMSQRSAQMWQEMTDSFPNLADILEDLKPLFESPVFLEFRRRYPLFGMIASFDSIIADSSFVQGLPNHWYRPGTKLYHAAGLNHVETLRRIFESEPELLNTIGGLNGTALQCACMCGFESMAEELITWGADVNLQSGRFGCAMNAAAANDNSKLIQRLFEAGARLDILDPTGRDALLHALSSSNKDTAMDLLNYGARVDIRYEISTSRDVWETTALLFSATYVVETEVVALLLEKGADISAFDEQGQKCLHLAARKGFAKLVDIILSRGEGDLVNALDVYGRTPLSYAISNGHPAVVHQLLSAGVKVDAPDKMGLTPLHLAVQCNQRDIVQTLLGLELDINTRNSVGKTSLHFAAQTANTEMIELLLVYGAEISAVDNIGSTPILHAAYSGQLESYKSLLQRGADERKTENTGNSVIYFAVCSGNIEMVRFLIDRGWDVNETNKKMETSVHWAVLSGASEVLAFLVDHGADMARPASYDKLPAHYAAQNGNTDCLKVLFDRDLAGDMECRDHAGYTPLQTAAYLGHVDVVELILGRVTGIIEDCTEDGWTPLALASFKGHALVMEALIENGANASALHTDGATLLQIAQDEGHIEAVKVLLKELHKRTSASEPHLNSPSNHRAARSRSLPPSEQREATPKERTGRSLSR